MADEIPGVPMADRADPVSDALTWWQDKQIAVAVGKYVVRGWVLRAAPNRGRGESDPLGVLTIVMLVDAAALAGRFPAEVVRAVRAGRPHGKPDGVLGVWDENDHTDVRIPRRTSPVFVAQARSGRRAGLPART
jgi:hypothetical protein